MADTKANACTRRDFLKAGTLTAGTLGLGLGGLPAAGAGGRTDVNLILLFLTGGPSHIDTFDPKPDAPPEVRGPFATIRTKVPGIHLSEHLPRTAAMADRFAIVRSVHHDAPPVHETGFQLMQTGHLFRDGREYPHYGAVLSHLRGPRGDGVPPFVLAPCAMGHTGISVSHGQGAGILGAAHEAEMFYPAWRTHRRSKLGHSPDAAAWDRFGLDLFGTLCLQAPRLIEQGARCVTVNMFDTVFDRVTWDCHADGGSLPATLDDYRTTLCPMFDRAYTTLLEDLEQRGLLETTLVVATGELGRTPYLNERGGRDHWARCWSVLFAGAGVRGGQVVGASDRLGGEPADRPVTPAEVAATVYHALGIDHRQWVDAEPIRELF